MNSWIEEVELQQGKRGACWKAEGNSLPKLTFMGYGRYENRVYVGAVTAMRQKILERMHNSPHGGALGRTSHLSKNKEKLVLA